MGKPLSPVMKTALVLGASYALGKLLSTSPTRALRKLRKTEKRLKARRCTPGVYVLEGNGRRRFGQSGCIEERAPRSAEENADSLGRNPRLYIIEREPNRSRRLRLERNLIIEDKKRAPRRNCNRAVW